MSICKVAKWEENIHLQINISNNYKLFEIVIPVFQLYKKCIVYTFLGHTVSALDVCVAKSFVFHVTNPENEN